MVSNKHLDTQSDSVFPFLDIYKNILALTPLKRKSISQIIWSRYTML